MPDKLSVREHKDPIIKKIMVFSVIALIIFSGLLLLFSGFWMGLFRLLAFAAFAVFILSYMQYRSKTKKISLEIDNQKLIINYYLSTEKNQVELFELATIKQIKTAPAPPVWNLIPRSECTKFEIYFTDSENVLSLFRFQGRDIFVSTAEASEIKAFLYENIASKITDHRAGSG